MSVKKFIQTTETNELWRTHKVEQVMGKHRVTLHRDIIRGILTKPVKIGGNRSAWPSNEITTIINARIAGKSDDEIRVIVDRLHNSRVA